MTVKPLLAPAIEIAERRRGHGGHYRYWWLAVIVFSLAGWTVVIGGVSLIASLIN